MKTTINRAALTQALKTCAGVADNKVPSPNLKSVLLRPAPGLIQAIATDLNVTVTIDVPATGTVAPVSMLVPAKRMLEVVSAAPGTEVSLSFDGGSFVEVKSGRWTGQVPTSGNPRDFPKVAECKSGLRPVPPESLQAVLKGCLPSVCKDETRFHLNGVLISAAAGVVRGVATDGHRLAKIERSCEHEWRPVIVPSKACRVIESVLDGAESLNVGVEDRWMFLRIGWLTIVSKLVDAQYPTWQQVVPQDHDNTATFDRTNLTESIERAKVALAGVDIPIVSLAINGDAKISARTSEGFTSDDLIDVEREGSDIGVAAAPAYLLDALRVLAGERVTLRCKGALDPLIFHPAGPKPTPDRGDLVVVMPMRT